MNPETQEIRRPTNYSERSTSGLFMRVPTSITDLKLRYLSPWQDVLICLDCYDNQMVLW
jgi:hypothetical protein